MGVGVNTGADRHAWLDALRRWDTVGLLALVDRCPPSDARDTARALVPDHDDVSLMALASLAQTMWITSNTVRGHDLASAVGEIVRDALATKADPRLLNVAEWSAEVETGSAAALTSGSEVVDKAAGWLSWLEARGSRTKSCVLALTAAEAWIAGDHPEKASGWLALADASPTDGAAVQERREIVRRRLSSALQEATELPNPFEGPTSTSVQPFASQLAQLRGQLHALPPDRQDRATVLLDRMEAGLAEDPPNMFVGGTQLQAELVAAFGMAGSPGVNQDVQQGTQSVMALLQDPIRGQDPAALRACIADAERVRELSENLGLSSEQNTMDWAISVCRRRRGEYVAAVDVLRRLWGSLEAQRAEIRDPIKRAGVFGSMPYLFVTLADCLYEAGRQDELLEVIEAGKGRFLEDLVLAQDLRTPEPRSTTWTFPIEERTHFLSFLVDDDRIFGVLLAADGSQHATRVELSRQILRAYAASVDPSTWGRSVALGKPRRPVDLPDRLAPLVSWLEPLLHAGVIAADDHVCYSPDDELHLIPLHLLTFAGRPLVETLSVSRLQSVQVLVDALQQPTMRPDKACVVEVPAADDGPKKAASFLVIGNQLAQVLPCERLTGPAATIAALGTRELTSKILHFTTHGTFPDPEKNSDQNPFRDSGLLLSTASGLPLRGTVTDGRSDERLLSPARLSSLDFKRSHVTMQACLSGLARDGAGGDALGVELALFIRGASSVLTTHWNVPVDAANEFCTRFYAAWLGKGLTRAQAWRATALSMKNDGRSAVEWAAFGLAGDWR